MILALTLAAGIGLSLGLLGSGGSIITLPVLVYAGGINPKEAVPMSLAIVGGTSLAGAVIKMREGQVSPRAALTFAGAGIPTAVLGAQLTPLVSPTVLLLLFALLMFLVAGRMLMGGNESLTAAPECRPARCLAAGGTVGVLTGFLGVGGGFLIVPAMVIAARMPLKVAIGSSLAVIAVNSFAGLAGQLRHTTFDWTLAMAFLALAVAGMFGGIWLSRIIAAPSLRRWFAWFVIAVAIFVVVQNLSAFGGAAKP
jgi:uncharacterized membrane protein YfcA